MIPRVLWFTGLSGSGKSTIANRLIAELGRHGVRVMLLDGDAVRDTIHKHLKFSPSDIKENNRLLALRCKDHLDSNDIIIVSAISPFKCSRENARKLLRHHFIEVYVKAGIEECIRRDVKGLYRRALNGEIDNFIGISENTPYEAPTDAEITLDTEKADLGCCVSAIMDYLAKNEVFKQ